MGEDVTHRPTDTVEGLDLDQVSRAGRVLDLGLRILARETTQVGRGIPFPGPVRLAMAK